MASSFIKCTNVTTTLTRGDSYATHNALAAEILALFKSGGAYDVGIDTARVQWNGSVFEVVLEDAVASSLAANLATLKSTIRTGLLTLSGVTALSTDDIVTLEMSSIATDALDDWSSGFDTPLGTGSGRQGYSAAGWSTGAAGTFTDEAGDTKITGSGADRCIERTVAGILSATADWELRVRMSVADGGTGAIDTGIQFDTGADTTVVFVAFIGGVLYYFSSGSQYVAVSTDVRLAANSTVVLTIRRRGDRLDVWADDVCVGTVRWSDLWTASSTYARSGLGVGHVHKTTSASHTIKIERVAARAGINPCSVSVGLLAGGWL